MNEVILDLKIVITKDEIEVHCEKCVDGLDVLVKSFALDYLKKVYATGLN